MMRRRFPPSYYNQTTFIGVIISIGSFIIILFLMLLDALASSPHPYMGIIAFVILPIILIFGLLLIGYGAYRQHKKLLAGSVKEYQFPIIDFNNPPERRAIIIFSISTVIFLMFSTFGSYKAYEYTDSDRFCGETCHTLMKPEYTAYQNSPHARVGCVKCHIGPGATWYVRSKFSGAYQIYATIFNKYPRPIPTPIANLRPAQETCEQCHWPEHFFSEKRRSHTYFISDEQNTGWRLEMLMKVGGGNEESGTVSGIHWHMNISNEITYIAIDSLRSIVPYIHVKHKDASEEIYRSNDAPEDSALVKYASRKMDCIDCHNRPSHAYNHPMPTVDNFMSIGWISPQLPFIKKVSIEAFERSYSSTEIAMDSIRIAITEYYKANYSTVFKNNRSTIDSAILQVQKIFNRNYFPEMKVSWQKFPNNIGHMYALGCFRCHDGKHSTSSGKILSKDCSICHTIILQEYENQKPMTSLNGLEYRHPEDIGDAWKEMNCSDCHLSQ